jgi:hypothetical protein
VTVEAAAPLLKTENGEVSYNVTNVDADNLPVLFTSASNALGANGFGNIRDPLAITQLIPGVVYSVDSALSVNGLPSNTEATRIEGQDASNPRGIRKRRSVRSAWMLSRKWPSRPAILLRNMGRRAEGISQLHHEVGDQRSTWKRLHVLAERCVECRFAVHRCWSY